MIGIVIIYIKRHHGAPVRQRRLGARRRCRTCSTNAHARQAASKYDPQFEWTVFWIALVGIVADGRGTVSDGHRRRKRRTAVPLGDASTVAEDLAADDVATRSTTSRPSPTHDAP